MPSRTESPHFDSAIVKLLFYSHYFCPSIGGTEKIVLSTASGLAQLRRGPDCEFEVVLTTQTPAGNFDDSTIPFRVVRRPTFVELWKLIMWADVVHVAGPAFLPLLIGLVAHKSLVVEHHGFQSICPNGQLLIEPTGIPCPGHFMAGNHVNCLRCGPDGSGLQRWKLWLLTFARRFLCTQVATNVTPTDFLRNLLFLPRTETIPHGIESIGFQAHPASDPPTIVFQGRLVSTKGVHILLKAASILRSAKRVFQLIVVGDGPERAALEKMTHEFGLRPCVRFIGRLSDTEMESMLASARAVVVPSLAGEVFGLVVLENMSRGLPVLASDIGAFSEVVGDAGISFRTGDPEDLARCLEGIWEDPSRFSRIGEQGSVRANRFFGRDQMIRAHAALYRRIHSSGRA